MVSNVRPDAGDLDVTTKSEELIVITVVKHMRNGCPFPVRSVAKPAIGRGFKRNGAPIRLPRPGSAAPK